MVKILLLFFFFFTLTFVAVYVNRADGYLSTGHIGSGHFIVTTQEHRTSAFESIIFHDVSET